MNWAMALLLPAGAADPPAAALPAPGADPIDAIILPILARIPLRPEGPDNKTVDRIRLTDLHARVRAGTPSPRDIANERALLAAIAAVGVTPDGPGLLRVRCTAGICETAYVEARRTPGQGLLDPVRTAAARQCPPDVLRRASVVGGAPTPNGGTYVQYCVRSFDH